MHWSNHDDPMLNDFKLQFIADGAVICKKHRLKSKNSQVHDQEGYYPSPPNNLYRPFKFGSLKKSGERSSEQLHFLSMLIVKILSDSDDPSDCDATELGSLRITVYRVVVISKKLASAQERQIRSLDPVGSVSEKSKRMDSHYVRYVGPYSVMLFDTEFRFT